MCDKNAICINTVGNYTCQCGANYRGDGSPGQCFRKILAVIVIKHQTSEIPSGLFFSAGGPVIRTPKEYPGNNINFINVASPK